MAVFKGVGAVVQQGPLPAVSAKPVSNRIVLEHRYRMHGIGLAELPDFMVVGVRRRLGAFDGYRFQVFRAEYRADAVFGGAMLELIDRAGKRTRFSPAGPIQRSRIPLRSPGTAAGESCSRSSLNTAPRDRRHPCTSTLSL